MVEAAIGEPVTVRFPRPRVLVVGPQGQDRAWLEGLFRMLGAECDTAEDGLEALLVLDRCGFPELVVAHVASRPCGGIELAQAMAETCRGRRPAVVLIGDPGDLRGHEAAAAGVVSGWVDRGRLRLGWTVRILAGLIGLGE